METIHPEIHIVALYTSPGHCYFGRHGLSSNPSPLISHNSIECVEGSGIRGDRFFEYRDNYKGQITFFAAESYDRLCSQLAVTNKDYSVFRRNIVTRGYDLNLLIGKIFQVQGIYFEGTQQCKPCYWMDLAFAPGAEAALQGWGGLRARILSSGTLSIDNLENEL